MTKVSLATLLLLLLSASSVIAQTEMADVMRADGKIYVVVVVLATIFAGIFAYLILLDRKISKIEKENNIN
jgi:CcmD family protein